MKLGDVEEKAAQGRRPGKAFEEIVFDWAASRSDPRARAVISIESVAPGRGCPQGIRYWGDVDDRRFSSGSLAALKAAMSNRYARAESQPWVKYIAVRMESSKSDESDSAALEIEIRFFEATGKPSSPDSVHRDTNADGESTGSRVESGWPRWFKPGGTTSYPEWTYVDDTPEHRAALRDIIDRLAEMGARVEKLFRRKTIRDTLAAHATGGLRLLEAAKGSGS